MGVIGNFLKDLVGKAWSGAKNIIGKVSDVKDFIGKIPVIGGLINRIPGVSLVKGAIEAAKEITDRGDPIAKGVGAAFGALPFSIKNPSKAAY